MLSCVNFQFEDPLQNEFFTIWNTISHETQIERSQRRQELLIHNRNATLRVTCLITSIYFGPGNVLEIEMCRRFCLNTMHRIFLAASGVCAANSSLLRLGILVYFHPSCWPQRVLCPFSANLAPKYMANLSFSHTTHIQLLRS
jgi:hypothetical protein